MTAPTEIRLPPLTAKQVEILKADDPDLLIEGSPRSAKSWGVFIKIWRLALEHPGIQIFLARYKDESLGQLRDVWTKVATFFPEWAQPKWNVSDHCWDFKAPASFPTAPDGQHYGSRVWLSSIKTSELDTVHSKYKGKTLAVIVVDEASELPYENFIGLQERLSQSKTMFGADYRYPLQFILVTNCVDEDHWLARPVRDGGAGFPVEGTNADGKRTIRVGLYDNARFLGHDVMMGFERRYPPGHSLRRTVIDGQRGLTTVGQAVYSGAFERTTHVSKLVTYSPYYPVLEGWDFGHEKPAVVWLQYQQHIGAVRILGWVKGERLFLETFAPAVLKIRHRLFPGVQDVWAWADPTGNVGNQGMQHTAIRLLHNLGVSARIDPHSNGAPQRYAAIQVLGGFMQRVATDGSPAFQMVPQGIELVSVGARVEERPSELMVTAFEAGYVWDEHAAPEGHPNIRRPKKGTRYDDLMNAAEYVVIGEQWSVPLAQELHRADARMAAAAQRVAQATIAESRRAVGPTGETLAEVERRLAQAARLHRDRDASDARRGRDESFGRRGGW